MKVAFCDQKVEDIKSNRKRWKLKCPNRMKSYPKLS